MCHSTVAYKSFLFSDCFNAFQKVSWKFKWYYEQKITFIISSDFETMFTKHSPSEILILNFEKQTVYFNKLQFSVLMVRHCYTRKDTKTAWAIDKIDNR